MVEILTILDWAGCILIILSLNLIRKSYKFWLLYVIASIIFSVTCFMGGLNGLGVCGIFLIATGFINYFKGGKK
jgi:hypothetical protein